VADARSKPDRPLLDGGEHSVMLPWSGRSIIVPT
jgi:hypothetical protein